MFLDILELTVENDTKQFRLNLFDNVVSDMWQNGLRKNFIIKFRIQGGKFWPLRNLLHMFLGTIELRVEHKNLSLEKTVLRIWSQKLTRSTSCVSRIRQRLLLVSCF